ncbi:MAG: hypothetical protein ACLFTT_02830 [Candidatus Hydrogenedentota bacterium]
MAQGSPDVEHLTDYERAICYYALPKMLSPITLSVLVAYAVCLLEAAAAMGYGFFTGDTTWTNAGIVATIALVLFGILVFTGHALRNNIRERRLLAAARGVPNALRDIPDMPDPFADHVLLRHPTHRPSKHFECTDENTTTRYLIEVAPNRAWWRITTPEGEDLCRMRLESHGPSFSLITGHAGRLTVYRDEAPLATIVPRFSCGIGHMDIEYHATDTSTTHIHGDTIIRDKRRVGRIYRLRGFLYLDIKREVCDEAILAYFATLT